MIIDKEDESMAKRDMTKAQFQAACKKHGFVKEPFMGYYRLPSGTSVSIWNAGPSRREQLAYLIQQNEKINRRTN
jgi:hypothetical protein